MNVPHPTRTLAFAGLAALLLGGCVNDAASYLVERESEQAITLLRNQNLFWEDQVQVTIVAEQGKQCQEGIDLKGIPRQAEIRLYQPPPGIYAEAIYILDVEGQHYAVATQPCGVDAFPGQAPELGSLIGTFTEKDSEFRFTPTER